MRQPHLHGFLHEGCFRCSSVRRVVFCRESRLKRIDREAAPDDNYILTTVAQNHSEEDEAWLASTYRKELIERYGEAGRHIHFAEAFGGCEYGTLLTKESIPELFPF